MVYLPHFPYLAPTPTPPLSGSEVGGWKYSFKVGLAELLRDSAILRVNTNTKPTAATWAESTPRWYNSQVFFSNISVLSKKEKKTGKNPIAHHLKSCMNIKREKYVTQDSEHQYIRVTAAKTYAQWTTAYQHTNCKSKAMT